MRQSLPDPPQWPLLLLMFFIIIGGGFCFASQLGLVNRGIEAFTSRAQTYLKQYQPSPALPTPPPLSAIDATPLLQAKPNLPQLRPTLSLTPTNIPSTQTTTITSTSSIATPQATSTSLATATLPPPIINPIQSQVTLSGFTHEWQKWNNCGPATIAMHLSYFGRRETQFEAAQILKPNQDDKNVSPAELGAYAQQLGFETYVGVGGNIDLLKHLLSNGLPVMVEFWTEPEDLGGMGHYRLLTGYDSAAEQFIAQDSLHGPNLTVPMAAFDENWQVFNRLYLLVYPRQQTALVHSLLGSSEAFMVLQALQAAQNEARVNPQNVFAWFNLGMTYARLGQPDSAASAFDEARRLGLPYRMLWYQFEIFETYLALDRFQEVIDLTTVTINGSGGLEELYYYRGLAHLKLEQADAAVEDFQAALDYNPNFELAHEQLARNN